MKLTSLKEKIKFMNVVLKNSKNYRKTWNSSTKDFIFNNLETIIKKTKLKADVQYSDHIQGLEAVSMSLGYVESGIYEKMSNKAKKPLLRMNGILIFQQLFNGKISIFINYPYIDGVGEPKNPEMFEIVRPHELTEEKIVEYVERFIEKVYTWEDYDDDIPPKPKGIGFSHQSASLDNA